MNPRCMRAVSMTAAAVFVAAFGPMGKASAVNVRQTVTIATGKVGGIYHPVGGAICKLVNDHTAEHGIACAVEITGGSTDNIKDLREGRVALAVAQSDSQYSAIKGIGPFGEDGPFDELRSMFAAYVEQFTLVARDDARINSFEDLRGKRVYLGPPGGGKRETMRVVLDALGWNADEIEDISDLKSSSVAWTTNAAARPKRRSRTGGNKTSFRFPSSIRAFGGKWRTFSITRRGAPTTTSTVRVSRINRRQGHSPNRPSS